MPICDKIKLLLEKKERLAEFITDEVHRKAFFKAKDEAFKLLRRLKPKKLAADLHYGFEDPCTTGQVLAGLSMLYPFWGEHVSIIPDFEQKVLEGSPVHQGQDPHHPFCQAYVEPGMVQGSAYDIPSCERV